jgi:hypothetical protein
MSLVPGLKHNLRQSSGLDALSANGVDLDPPENNNESDDSIDWEGKPLLRVEHEDGSITISLDGKPVNQDDTAAEAAEWFANLVDDIDQMELSRIANDLLRGVEDDLESRREWVEDRALGIRLLGFKIDVPGSSSSSDGAPVEGMSKVRHPLLAEACIRFQANARSELLPTDGPVKVRVDMNGSTIEMDELATDLEADLNHYLTDTAVEYYPDTDRMLLMLGFGGTAFKKIYFCPLRGRPISESVDANDLIVNNMALTLEDARRVTHRVMMRPSTVKRLQILGVYRDVDLTTPMPSDPDAVQQEKASQQGLAPDASTAEDRDREIYECYCELDIKGFEHKHKGKITGLEIPYRVTIDVSSREILSIVRNYDEPQGSRDFDAKKGSSSSYDVLPRARKNFVKFSFVPGLGFYDIGLLHILGNTTNAVTAAWREMLDAGMFANFPGFLLSDNGARQQTNIFRVPPGGAAIVKTGGVPINQAVMPLPYKEPGAAMFNLVNSMVETGQRIGMTAEMAVGEGRQDAPVGTTLAMIDQATKVLNSVHKRLHRAQTEEFRLLVRTFKEHPDSFLNTKSDDTPSVNKKWTEQRFVQALNSYQLVPQADPNTASQMQRQMKVLGLKECQAANPSLYDPVAIDIAALKALGWSNPEQFMVPEEKREQLPPEMMAHAAMIKIQKQEADAKTMAAQASMIKAQQSGNGQDPNQPPDPAKMAEFQLKAQELQHKQQAMQMDQMVREQDAQLKMAEMRASEASSQRDNEAKQSEMQAKLVETESKHQASTLDATNRQRDRESKERIAAVQLAEKIAAIPGGQRIADKLIDKGMIDRLESQESTIPGTAPAYPTSEE